MKIVIQEMWLREAECEVADDVVEAARKGNVDARMAILAAANMPRQQDPDLQFSSIHVFADDDEFNAIWEGP